jgi:hypothetical protein
MIKSTYQVKCDHCDKDITYSLGHSYDSMVSIRYVKKQHHKGNIYTSFSTDKDPAENNKDFCDIECLKRFINKDEQK